MEKQKVQDFLKRLSALSRETGLSIHACGCCHSPWISDEHGIGYYEANEDNAKLDYQSIGEADRRLKALEHHRQTYQTKLNINDFPPDSKFDPADYQQFIQQTDTDINEVLQKKESIWKVVHEQKKGDSQ